MKNIGIWLYRYMAMHVDHILAMLSDPVPRPALQRVRTSVSPSLSDVRLSSKFLTPGI